MSTESERPDPEAARNSKSRQKRQDEFLLGAFVSILGLSIVLLIATSAGDAMVRLVYSIVGLSIVAVIGAVLLVILLVCGLPAAALGMILAPVSMAALVFGLGALWQAHGVSAAQALFADTDMRRPIGDHDTIADVTRRTDECDDTCIEIVVELGKNYVTRRKSGKFLRHRLVDRQACDDEAMFQMSQRLLVLGILDRCVDAAEIDLLGDAIVLTAETLSELGLRAAYGGAVRVDEHVGAEVRFLGRRGSASFKTATGLGYTHVGNQRTDPRSVVNAVLMTELNGKVDTNRRCDAAAVFDFLERLSTDRPDARIRAIANVYSQACASSSPVLGQEHAGRAARLLNSGTSAGRRLGMAIVWRLDPKLPLARELSDAVIAQAFATNTSYDGVGAEGWLRTLKRVSPGALDASLMAARERISGSATVNDFTGPMLLAIALRGEDADFAEAVRALTAASDAKLVQILKWGTNETIPEIVRPLHRRALFDGLLHRSRQVDPNAYCEYLAQVLRWSFPTNDARPIVAQAIDARIEETADAGLIQQFTMIRQRFTAPSWRGCHQ